MAKVVGSLFREDGLPYAIGNYANKFLSTSRYAQRVC